MADRIVDVLVNFGIDKDKAREVQAELDKTENKITKLEKSVSNLKKTSQSLDQIFSRMSAAGAVIFAPAILSANKYVEAVGRAESGSARWLDANRRLQQSQIDFGRKATETLVPYLEILADITEKLNSIDPRILEVGITAGGLLAAVGAAGLLGSQVIKMVAATRELVVAISAMQAAGGFQGAMAGGLKYGAVGLGAVGLGGFLGLNIAQGIGRVTGNERMANTDFSDVLETVKQGLAAVIGLMINEIGKAAKTLVLINGAFEAAKLKFETETDGVVGAIKDIARAIHDVLLDIEILGKNLGEALGLERSGGFSIKSISEDIAAIRAGERKTPAQRAAEIAQNTQDSLDSIDQFVQGATESMLAFFGFVEREAATTAGSALPTEALDAFDRYQMDVQNIEAQAFEVRRQKIADFNEETAELERNWQETRQRQLDDFQRTQAEAEKRYRQQLGQLDDQYRKAIAESERGYQERRQETIEQFEKDELQRRETFDIKRRRQMEQASRDLQEAARKLDATAVLRILQNQNTQQQRDREDFDRETKQRQEAQQDRLAQLDKGYQEERRKRDEQYRESRRQMETAFREQQRQQREAFNRQRALEAENFRRSMQERQTRHQRELQDLAIQTRRLLDQRQRAFNNELNQLMGWQNYETSARAAHYRRLQAQLEAYIRGTAAVGATTTRTTQQTMSMARQGHSQLQSISQFQEGGYHDYTGMYYGHQDEFTFSASATRALERAVGGRLTQQNVTERINNSRNFGNMTFNIYESRNPQNTRRELIQILNEIGA